MNKPFNIISHLILNANVKLKSQYKPDAYVVGLR